MTGQNEGSPLPPSVRHLMETRFGRDFGSVRLHTDGLAAASARVLRARAYTVGAHIVFGRACYKPETREGLWLLAHELSHVAQQSGGYSMRPCGLLNADDTLERAADQAADLVASGYSVPPDFAFGIAPVGVVQCHEGPQCGGWSSLTDATSVRQAERILELAYGGRMLGRPRGSQPPVVLYGSNDFQWPDNVPSDARLRRYINDLLATILTWPREERPNILDWTDSEAYFFWPFPAPTRVVQIINRFQGAETNIARRHYAGSQFNSAASDWFPDHALPFPPDPLERFICTSMTNHQPPRGLILYDIRQRKKPRRAQRRAMSYELWTADVDMAEFFPFLKEELPRAVQYFDPDNSNFVFIVPADFYWEYYSQKQTNKIWDSHTIRPSYDFPGGQAVKELRARLHHVSKLLGIVSLGVIVVGTIVIVVPLVAGAVAAAWASATTGTAAGAGAAVSLPATTTVVGPAGVVVQSWAVSWTAASAAGGATAGLWALAAAPATKAIVATAGVLLVIGRVENAHAGTNLPDNPVVSNASAFRAVAVADFKPQGSMQAAFSSGPPYDFFHTPETAKGKFDVGTKVLYDNVPHIIIGGFSVS